MFSLEGRDWDEDQVVLSAALSCNWQIQIARQINVNGSSPRANYKTHLRLLSQLEQFVQVINVNWE